MCAGGWGSTFFDYDTKFWFWHPYNIIIYIYFFFRPEISTLGLFFELGGLNSTGLGWFGLWFCCQIFDFAKRGTQYRLVTAVPRESGFAITPPHVSPLTWHTKSACCGTTAVFVCRPGLCRLRSRNLERHDIWQRIFFVRTVHNSLQLLQDLLVFAAGCCTNQCIRRRRDRRFSAADIYVLLL